MCFYRNVPLYCVLVLVILLNSACGPVYKTINHYTPPTDEGGKACVAQCEIQRGICQGECNRTYHDCLRDARMESRVAYLDAREGYLREKELCLRGVGAKLGKDCEKLSAPSQSNTVNDYHCKQDCGCDPAFERCFEMCGGQIFREKHCVSDCQ